MSKGLKGKTALVTGGGRGIGKAIAKRLAEAGANVVIASRKLENLQETAREFSSLPGKTAPIACHVGLRTTGGTQGVGRSTTVAVVAGSVAVIAVDFFVTRMLMVLL